MTTIFVDRSHPVEAKPTPGFALLACGASTPSWRPYAFAGAPER
jgi:hypothetical protein